MSALDQEEEDVLKKYAKNLRKDGEVWTGNIESDAMLVSMELELSTLGVSFVTQCSKHHGQENSKEESRPRFSVDYGALPLRLDIPFRLISRVRKGCFLGKDQHRIEEKRAAAMSVDCSQESIGDSPNKKKRKLQGTKKRGCTATMHIKIIEAFPDFKVEAADGASEHKIRRLRTAQLAKLSDALLSEQELRTERMIFFSMTRRSLHTEHDFSGVIRPRLTAKDMEEKYHVMEKELRRVLKLAEGSAGYAKLLDAVIDRLKEVNTSTDAHAFLLRLKASCTAVVKQEQASKVQSTRQSASREKCHNPSLPRRSKFTLGEQPVIVAEADFINYGNIAQIIEVRSIPHTSA